ncbi:MAG: hypothetical protein BIFFINMI_00540 [Phycisphaerae bacterium]|nr:hypothetical protein [Phycisphaerae bacterium]
MSDCLDDIQLEDALAGEPDAGAAGHLAACQACRGRLAEARELKTRLRQAFADVHVSPQAEARVRSLSASGGRSLLRRWWPLAAAACLAAGLTVVAVMRLGEPAPAQAAAMELVELHRQNLAGGQGMQHESAADAQAYLRRELGFQCPVPDELGERRMKSCCVSRFLGRKAGNMVVQGPHGQVSLIVSDVNARQLQTGRKIEREGRTFWVCPMSGFRTVAVQQGGLIYCAVGDETPDYLAELLGDLLDRSAGQESPAGGGS